MPKISGMIPGYKNEKKPVADIFLKIFIITLEGKMKFLLKDFEKVRKTVANTGIFSTVFSRIQIEYRKMNAEKHRTVIIRIRSLFPCSHV